MSDVIFAEGNTKPHNDLPLAKVEILEKMEGALQDVVENSHGDHANPDLYKRALSKSFDLANQWLKAVANEEQARQPAGDLQEDRISALFGIVSCIYDDASMGRENASDLDAQRAVKLVSYLDCLQQELALSEPA